MIVAVAVVFSVSTVAQKNDIYTARFPAETTEVPERIILPPGAMKMMLADKEEYSGDMPASLTCQKQDVTDATIDAVYRLLCAKVRLSPTMVGLLVMGTGDFRGATNAPFWLFETTSDGTMLVLKTRAEGVDILKAMEGGQAMVEVTHVKGSVTTLDKYSFDGTRYVKK